MIDLRERLQAPEATSLATEVHRLVCPFRLTISGIRSTLALAARWTTVVLAGGSLWGRADNVPAVPWQYRLAGGAL